MAKLMIEGKEKEIKFVTAHKNDNAISIAFTDQTMIYLEDVKVNIAGSDLED